MTARRVPVWLPILLLAIVSAAYVALAGPAGHPLTLFVLVPLVVAGIGTPTETMLSAVLTVGVAGVVGLLDDDLTHTSVLTRLGVITVASLLATNMSYWRGRHVHDLQEAESAVDVLATFQSNLAPVLAVPPVLYVDTVYQPGDERMKLGGDFMDVVALPDGAIGFIVGDVCGHGPEAAAVGAAMRSAWRGVSFADPGDVIAWFSAMEGGLLGDSAERTVAGFVTALAGRFDPADHSVTVVSAGHPLPVLIGETTGLLDAEVRTPLGVRVIRPARATRRELAPGERIVVYTDGLIENRRPNSRQRWSEGELHQWLAENRGDGEIDLQRLLEHFGPDGFNDDVAILVLGPTRGAVLDRTDRLRDLRPLPT